MHSGLKKRADKAQQEHGAWMIAYGHEEAALLDGKLPLPDKIPAGLCPHGAAAEETGNEGVAAVF
ncbi:unknown [Clostridium sp. CAG:58]|nr:unknown [Clostridium sp. CAG:58]